MLSEYPNLIYSRYDWGNGDFEEAIEGAGTELGVPVAVEDVSIRIFRGSGQITGFDVGNPAGYQAEHAFDMDLIRVNLNLLSIFSRPLTLDELIIDSPVVNLELKGRGASNFKEISR